MYSAIHAFELNEWSDFMSDYLLDGHQIRTLAAVFLALLVTSCIQEAEWTWTGDTSQGDASADQVTQDSTVDIILGDLSGVDTDVPVPTDTEVVEPFDTETVQPDTADILPGPAVLVVAVPAVFSGESNGDPWTLRPMVQGGATAGQASVGEPWILEAVLNGGSDAE